MKVTNNSFLKITEISIQNKRKIEKNKKLSRVEEIKNQIKNETYKIEINKTAKAMVKYLLK